MQIIPRFNPYSMTDDQILKLHTGQDASLKWMLSTIQNNQNQIHSKHVVVCGPYGSGKSFLLRRLQIHFKPYKTIACFLFPEVQTNIFHPDDFLASIQSVISCEYAFQLVPKWFSPSRDHWQKHLKTIGELLKKSSYKHVIIGIENLNTFLSEGGVFSSSSAQQLLKDFLTNSSWLTLVTTYAGCNLPDDANAIFKLFSCHNIPLWQEQDHERFIKKFFKKHDYSSDVQSKIKYKALARFTGGTPRNVLILADILRNEDLLSTTHALEKAMDIMTPFFQTQLFAMQPGHRLLIDALIRGGEPCSLKELGNRVQAKSSRISESISWLVNQGVLSMEACPPHETVMYITDRLFVHYYRMRHIHVHNRTKMLASVSEFLTTFYDHQELKQYAENFYWDGNVLIARDLMHIALSHAGLTIKALSWREDTPSLFHALNICEANDYELPKSEKKVVFQRSQMLDLLAASQYGPDHLDKKRLGRNILGSLFLDEKMRRYLFQKCIQNKLSQNQWMDLDLYLIVERIKLQDGYGDILIRLMDQIASGEILPDIIRESRIKRLKKDDPEIYHALIAFFSERLPFEVSSSEIFDSHKHCLTKLAKKEDVQAFHLEQMGWQMGWQKQFTKAVDYFQKALAVRKKNAHIKKQAWIFSQIGWCHQSLKEYEIALNFHEQACEYYSRFDDLINQAWNLGCIARIYGKRRHYETAIEKHHEALCLLEKQADRDLSAWNWSRIARNLTRLKRYDEAMNAHHTALNLIENENNIELEAWNLEGMAWIYGKIDQYEEAIKTQQKALKFRSQEGNISQQAWNLEGIGWGLGKLERYEEALKVLNRAFKIRERTRHVSGQAWNLEGIARYLGNLSRHEEAIAVHKRAFLLQEQKNNIDRQIWNYRGIAWNYKEMNVYDQSILFLYKALEKAERSDNLYWQPTLLGLIGWNLRQAHRLTDAIDAHEKAISIYKAQNNFSAIFENAGQVAINYFILGDTGRAWHILDHYGEGSKNPNKLISRMGDAVIYLEKNVRKATALKTGTDILDGIWYRRNQWNISPIIQCFFLALVKAEMDTFLIQKLVIYIHKRCGNLLDEPIHIIFALVKYIHSGRNPRLLKKMEPDQRRAVEALMESLGI
ncbi:MAG: tetratricopeptide repeat protein [Candidatus Magnetomorum sp.]|nr:tetratricopeptide repeat protein [Candidatus Magnetomorum sp.]